MVPLLPLIPQIFGFGGPKKFTFLYFNFGKKKTLLLQTLQLLNLEFFVHLPLFVPVVYFSSYLYYSSFFYYKNKVQRCISIRRCFVSSYLKADLVCSNSLPYLFLLLRSDLDDAL